jgi:hypothetical protein
MKFLIKDIGRDELCDWLMRKKAALSYQTIKLTPLTLMLLFRDFIRSAKVTIEDTAALKLGKIKCHSSKQAGYYAIGIKVL